MKPIQLLLCALFGVAVLVAGNGVAHADTVMRVSDGDMSCDRACLDNFVDEYLKAMAAHDPSGLPLTKNVRLTENTVQLNIGDGLWSTTTGIGKDGLHLDDVFAQQAGYIGVIYERDGPKMLALRLRIKNMRIEEIEMVTARPGSSDPLGKDLKNWKPRPIWNRQIKAADRESRDALVQTANAYFNAIEKDQQGVVHYVDGCTMGANRQENGAGAPPPDSPFAKMPCDAMFGHGMMAGLKIPERSFWAVDPENGTVLGAFIFQLDKPQLITPGQKLATSGGGLVGTQPNSGIIVEAFKIIDGKIYEQDGVTGMIYAYGNRTGW